MVMTAACYFRGTSLGRLAAAGIAQLQASSKEPPAKVGTAKNRKGNWNTKKWRKSLKLLVGDEGLEPSTR